MSARSVRVVEEAREVANWMEQHRGGKYRANVVRRVCRSNDVYRGTLSQLHAHNRELRRLLPSKRAISEAEDRRELELDLRTSADQLDRMVSMASLGGDEVGVRVKDTEYLVALMRRAADAIP